MTTRALNPNHGEYLYAGNLWQVAMALCQEILDIRARLVEFGVFEFDDPPMWLPSETQEGVVYLNPLGNPILGECMRLWAQVRAELIHQLQAQEEARLSEVEE